MTFRNLWRTWFACLVLCLPILALLLVPQLMRSRAGSSASLMLGVSALLVLLVAAFVFAPAASAWSSPAPGWQPRIALRTTRALWRRRTGASVLALIAGLGIYAIGQIAGYALAEAVPHVHENPVFAADRSQSPWIIDYPAFALQAFALYAMTTLAVAVYAWSMRALSLRAASSVIA
ncbi:hypothetical protein M2317_002134 [Microbacterium sp. ZKA21]|uniref:hypothetical protein n=1 Tax=Microbacterium sp. ZKA21 TaxID=3381694 RepID=UPI003D19EF74